MGGVFIKYPTILVFIFIFTFVVKCRNQLDCVWVSDERGETLCTEAEAQYSLGIGFCQCFDVKRVDAVTGRCMLVSEAKDKPVPLLPGIPKYSLIHSVNGLEK